MVSAFGSTDAPTSSGKDAVSTANSMASFVKTWGLDGIDVDYEDFNGKILNLRYSYSFSDSRTQFVTAINKHDGSAENWLITFTRTLRAALPAGSYLITHAR